MFRWVTQFADNVSAEWIEALSDPEQCMRSGEIIKDDKSTTVVSCIWGNEKYIIKRFNARDKGHAIKRSLRKTRARNCWEISEILVGCGVNVAQPIALLEARHGTFRGDSYFVSKQLEGLELLECLPKEDLLSQERIGQQIKALFTVFSNQRISHGDMKASNLIWSNEQIFLIDLDVAKQHSNRLLFARAHSRDKRRFGRNGKLFSQMIEGF